jgi:hypothetical protein
MGQKRLSGSKLLSASSAVKEFDSPKNATHEISIHAIRGCSKRRRWKNAPSEIWPNASSPSSHRRRRPDRDNPKFQTGNSKLGRLLPRLRSTNLAKGNGNWYAYERFSEQNLKIQPGDRRAIVRFRHAQRPRVIRAPGELHRRRPPPAPIRANHIPLNLRAFEIRTVKIKLK